MNSYSALLVMTILRRIGISGVMSDVLWLSKPPDLFYTFTGQDVVFNWSYSGVSLTLGKWGLSLEKNIISKIFAMYHPQLNPTNATILPAYQSKLEWRPNALMKIKNVSLADNGTYGCNLDFKDGSNLFDSSTLLITQIDTLEKTGTSQIILHEGDNFTLSVSATVSPWPKVEWFKDGIRVEDGFEFSTFAENQTRNSLISFRFQLFAKNQNRTASGNYQPILVFGSSRFPFKNFVVLFQYPPGKSTKFVTNTGITVIEEGTSVVLNCTASSYPPSTFEITRPVGLLHNSSGTLKIPSMNMTYEGLYNCSSINSLGRGENKSLFIISGVRPHHLITNTNRNASSLSPLQISWKIISRPKSNIVLYKDGHSLPGRYIVRNSTYMDGLKTIVEVNITLETPQILDSGVFSCVAVNILGMTEVNHTINVLLSAPPVFLPNGAPTNFTVLNGENTRFFCLAKSNVYAGRITYTWNFEGKVIPGYSDQPQGNLTLVSVNVTNAGKYSCTASDGTESITGNAYLEVHVPPTIKSSSGNIQVASGNSITLTCKAEGNPTPRVIWKQKNISTVVFVGEDFYFDTTGMAAATIFYVCEASNAVGVISKTIQVSVTAATSKDSPAATSKDSPGSMNIWLMPLLIVVILLMVVLLLLLLAAFIRKNRTVTRMTLEETQPSVVAYSSKTDELESNHSAAVDDLSRVNFSFMPDLRNRQDSLTLNPLYMNGAYDGQNKQDVEDLKELQTKNLMYLPEEDDIKSDGREAQEASIDFLTEDQTNESPDLRLGISNPAYLNQSDEYENRFFDSFSNQSTPRDSEEGKVSKDSDDNQKKHLNPYLDLFDFRSQSEK